MSFLGELKRRNVFRMAVLYGVSAWLLLQVGDVLFDLMGLPDWSLRLLLAILLLGFPVALIFAWVYELTPQGLKRERDVDRDQSVTQHTARKLDLAVIALLVVSLGIFIADRAGLLPEKTPVPSARGGETIAAASPSIPEPEPASIAVLPFVNMSADAEQTYFSDGLAESLLHLLAQIRELRVAARTSSFRFRDHTGDVAEIGRQLNVAHVLEGSVRRSGDTLRVTAQLIKASDGYHLWSGTWDREMDDVFAIQDEIAARVVDALEEQLLGTGSGPELPAPQPGTGDTANLAAYEAYLRGREQLHVGSYVTLPKAEAYFQEALALDPDYELAMVGLGETYHAMVSTGQMSNDQVVPRMRSVGDRILARNPDSAPGEAILGWTLFIEQPEEAHRVLQSAYQADPNHPFVALSFGTFLDFAGRHEEAAAVLERALARDPMSPDLHLRLALTYDQIDPEQALHHAARLRALEPESPNALYAAARVHSQTGRYVEAIKLLEAARGLDPEDPELPAEIALNLIAFGALDEARDYIDQGKAISGSAPLPVTAEVVLLQRSGRRADAAARLQRMIDEGYPPRQWGYPVGIAVMQDEAVRARDADRYLLPLGSWLRVDFDAPDLDRSEAFARLMAVPALVSAGRTDQAEAVIRAARQRLSEWEDTDLEFPLAIATRDVHLLMDQMDQRFKRPLDWLLLDLEWVRDLAGDNPRYMAWVQALKANEREQARLWAQYRETGE